MGTTFFGRGRPEPLDPLDGPPFLMPGVSEGELLGVEGASLAGGGGAGRVGRDGFGDSATLTVGSVLG